MCMACAWHVYGMCMACVRHVQVVFKERTLDFAATTADQLIDWYLALAALIPASSEPLLNEAQLRERITGMGLGVG